MLGGGKRLFADGAGPATFRLVDATTTSGGLALLTYERAPASASPDPAAASSSMSSRRKV
jgi:hypothetical protein